MNKKTYLLLLAAVLTFSTTLKAQWFTNCNYVGAMDATTDWTKTWANWTPQTTIYTTTNKTVSGDITSSQTWTKNDVVLLSGFVYVKNGATLTIEAGCVIRGDKATKGTLIITRGSKLIANATVTEPIVFTSNEAAGGRNYGDWGGLIILGKAKINPAGGTAAIEGGVDNANGDGQYGGTDNADNSGSLKYVRIEFPGIAFQPNSEINGITMGGVGSGTMIDWVQVSYSGDDSYEWFGGTVNAKHLIAFRGWDDDFDTDFGYSGNVQFGVSLRDSAVADQSGSNSFESDNDGTGSTNSPFTSAIFSNFTVIGPKVNLTNPINNNFKRAAHIRRNSRVSIYNSIFTGFPTGLLVDGTTTLANLNANDFQFENNMTAGCTKYTDTAGMKGATFDVKAWFDATAKGNRHLTLSADANLTDPFNYNAPDFRPTSGSPAMSGYSYKNSRLVGYNNLLVNEVEALNLDGLYPNPATENVNLNVYANASGQLTINLFDAAGARVMTQASPMNNGLNTMTLNTNTLPQGVYFLNGTMNGSSFTKRLVIVK